jgi:hypothetical protein
MCCCPVAEGQVHQAAGHSAQLAADRPQHVPQQLPLLVTGQASGDSLAVLLAFVFELAVLLAIKVIPTWNSSDTSNAVILANVVILAIPVILTFCSATCNSSDTYNSSDSYILQCYLQLQSW